jgi:hypothetical protein
MRLLANGRSYRIAQLGPDFLILRDKVDSPPTEGEITLNVDGHEESWRVHLPDGLTPMQTKTPVTKR